MDVRRLIAIVNAGPSKIELIRECILGAGHHVMLVESNCPLPANPLAGPRPDLAIVALRSDDSAARENLESLASAGIPLVALFARGDSVPLEIRTLAALTAILVEPLEATALIAAIEIALRQIERIAVFQRRLDDARQELADRKQIERAKGRLMEQNSLSESAAFKLMQQLARSSRRTLIAVAQDIIRCADLLVALPPAPALTSGITPLSPTAAEVAFRPAQPFHLTTPGMCPIES